jgi:phage baseplate assembly protein W
MPTIGWVGPGLPQPASSAVDGRFLFTSEVKKDESLIIDSMTQIILTRRGERPMNPLFGSRLHAIPFDQDFTAAIDGLADEYVREALQMWEPRVVVEGVRVSRDTANTLNIKVDFSVKRTGLPGTFTLRARF